MQETCDLDFLSEGLPIFASDIVNLTSRQRFPLNLTLADRHGREIEQFSFAPNHGIHPPNSIQENLCHLASESDFGRSSLSLCDVDSVSGVFILQNNFYTLRVTNNKLVLLPHGDATCDFQSRTKRAAKVANGLPVYYKPYISGNPLYVELALFADKSLHEKYGEKVTDRLKAIANHVDSLYSPLNIFVRLVFHEIWTEENKVDVSALSDSTLDKFLTYRKTVLTEKPHDNAQLVTEIEFQDGVVGKAFKGTMCSIDYSGGVIMDHKEDAALVAATMAHEMGHNFGMGHDPTEGNLCECKNEHCLMHPTAGYNYPAYWSECSLRQLFNALNRGVDFCLKNEPGAIISDKSCGNGIVDPGEQCDCGANVCPHDCCDGATCRLRENAECGAGRCCDLSTCKRKPRATVCRSATDMCDLAEYCDGETDDCPANFFMQDGALCPGLSDAYCYNGQCGSRDEQCKKLWGEGSKDGSSICYADNVRGIFQGNCGTVTYGNYTPCARTEIMCGRLQCDTLNEKPVIADQNVLHGFTTHTDPKTLQPQMCRMVDSKLRDKNREPGLVNDGAVCAPNKVCLSKKCTPLQDIKSTTTDCDNNCFNRGVCNNVGNCHCEFGYGGVSCDIPGFGGSVNSNPAALSRGFSTLAMAVVILVLFAGVFAALTVYYHRKKNIWLPAICWDWTKEKLKLRGVLVPVRKAPPPPGGHHRMKRASLNAGWGENHVVTYRTSDNSVPMFHPAAPTLPMLSRATPNDTAPTHDGLAYGMGFPAQAVISPNKSGATVSRTGSLRPRDPPPMVPGRPRNSTITALYEERAEELGLDRPEPKELVYKPVNLHPPDPQPPTLPTKGPKVSNLPRSESMNRPEQRPPPPPSSSKPHFEKSSKPAVPVKPPISGRKKENSDDEQSISVSDIRARFEKK